MNTRSRRFSKGAIIASANSARIPITIEQCLMRAPELVESLLVLSVIHWQVVGIDRVAHETDPVSFHGVGNDGNGPIVGVQKPSGLHARSQECGDILPV